MVFVVWVFMPYSYILNCLNNEQVM